MKKSLTLIFLLCSIVSFAQNTTGTFTDKRDGKIYKTVVIGNQVWTIKNLDVSTFRNGDPITEAKTKEEWIKTGKERKPAWCYYDNDTANGRIYGKIYNWYAVNDTRGLAPAGWHVPTDAEWTTLTNFLGGEGTAGKKMKSTSGWKETSNTTNTNTSGFSGLPGGGCLSSGTFYNKEGFGYWWSSTEVNSSTGVNTNRIWNRNLNYYNGIVNRGGSEITSGEYVRCIKN